LKILVFYQYFGTPSGSWSTRVYEFTRRWVQDGHEVTVITAPYEKSDIRSKQLIDRRMIDGIRLVIINFPDSNRNGFLKRAFNALAFSLVSLRFALFENADRVVCSSGPITIAVPGIIMKRFRKTPFIFEVRDLWPAGGIEMGLIRFGWQKKMMLWFEKFCYESADLIVAASTGQQTHILNRFPSLKTIVVPNASDVDLFIQSNPPPDFPDDLKDKFIFLYAGSLGFIHHVEFLLQACRYLQENFTQQSIILLLIGEGSEKSKLEQYAVEHKLANVRFLGLKPKTEIASWMSVACASVFTTLDNPIQDTCSPNKVFDSFAAGVPVIQTTRGWIKDLVEKENCGINVRPGDFRAMAEAMVYLSKNNEARELKSVNAKRLSETDFNRELLSKKYLNAICSAGN
jgi:glycosyltransferase involved in cell wall biosynthesis